MLSLQKSRQPVQIEPPDGIRQKLCRKKGPGLAHLQQRRPAHPGDTHDGPPWMLLDHPTQADEVEDHLINRVSAMLDPDKQVQDSLRHFFEVFTRTGSAM